MVQTIAIYSSVFFHCLVHAYASNTRIETAVNIEVQIAVGDMGAMQPTVPHTCSNNWGKSKGGSALCQDTRRPHFIRAVCCFGCAVRGERQQTTCQLARRLMYSTNHEPQSVMVVKLISTGDTQLSKRRLGSS